jgi:hypothetical protein
MEFLPDGRVKLMYDFAVENEKHDRIFSPAIAKEANSVCRWSLPEERVVRWNTSGDPEMMPRSIRIVQAGTAHLNAYFADDVEAEMWVATRASANERTTAALVYSTGNKSLGSDWGARCAVFQAGKVKKAKGVLERVSVNTHMRIKLVVRNGVFEAYRDGRLRETEEYSRDAYSSGKIGFVWGGGVSIFIYKLEIIGRVDMKKTAQLIQAKR